MIIFEPCWQKELNKSFTDPVKLLQFVGLSPKKYTDDVKARTLFPLRVPRPFASRIKKGDPNDPLLRQVLTDKTEFDEVAGYTTDPLEEHQAVLPGLLHKYKSRVLILVRGGCAVNCRYCFRRHFPYQDNGLNTQKMTAVIEYIVQNTEINEVILSGGDPLMANDEHLGNLITQIENISHVRRLRIHTRLPVVIPQRLTAQLSTRLKNTRLKVIFVTHINHANEIDTDLATAFERIQHPNITLLNQAVLLKNVNATVTDQVNLSEKLFSVGILPYYIHVLDKVAGAAHFDLDINDAKTIYQGMLAELPGFLMPKWAKEESNKTSKTPITFIE